MDELKKNLEENLKPKDNASAAAADDPNPASDEAETEALAEEQETPETQPDEADDADKDSDLDDYTDDDAEDEADQADDTPLATYMVDCPKCDAMVYFEEEDIVDGKVVCAACDHEAAVDTDILDAYKADMKEWKEKDKKRRFLMKLLLCAAGFVVGLAVVLTAVYFFVTSSVVKVADIKISAKEYECIYFYDVVAYADYSSYGFDATKPHRDQKFEVEVTGLNFDTWYDFFKNNTNSTIQSYYLLAQNAEKNGMELDEEELAAVDSEIAAVQSDADAAGKSFKKFMKDTYGAPISKRTLRKFIETRQLCAKYYVDFVNSYEVTDAELDAEYAANVDTYDLVSFRYTTVQVDSDSGTDGAKKKVQESFDNVKTEDEFHEAAMAYIDEAELAEYEGVDATLIEGFKIANLSQYLAEDTIDFLLNDQTKPLEIFYTLSNDGSYYEVVMLVKARQRDESVPEGAEEEAWKITARQAIQQAQATEFIQMVTEANEVRESKLGMLFCKY